jgi:hypothetical protein
LKWSFVNSIIWKPFDVRFGTLLRRYKAHQEIFELEMRVASHSEVMEVSSKFEDIIKKVEHQSGEHDEYTREMEAKEIGKHSITYSLVRSI